jgi:SAM-dependent methyltransferase
VVVSLFALPHLPDPVKAVSEMSRVLRPGGRIVVAVGSGPPFSLGGARELVRRTAALIQQKRGRRLVAPSFLLELMERHLPEAPNVSAPPAHLGPREVEPLLDRAGFVGLRRSWDGHESVLASAEEFWEVQYTFSSVARRRLTTLSAEALAPLRREFFERCEAVLASGGRLAYPYGATFFVGTRPEGSRA